MSVVDAPQVVQDSNEKSTDSIQEWLTVYLANLLDMQADDVDAEMPFESYGLDSAAAVAMTGDLEDWLGHELEPTLVYDYPTIEKLANHLGEE